jgi:hypothetical protein
VASNEDEDRLSATSNDRTKRHDDTGPVPDRALAIFMALLALALVLGYLFLNKLVDISQEEDCALAHRRNCGAVEQPAHR